MSECFKMTHVSSSSSVTEVADYSNNSKERKQSTTAATIIANWVDELQREWRTQQWNTFGFPQYKRLL